MKGLARALFGWTIIFGAATFANPDIPTWICGLIAALCGLAGAFGWSD
jgi:hypothetical protein